MLNMSPEGLVQNAVKCVLDTRAPRVPVHAWYETAEYMCEAVRDREGTVTIVLTPKKEKGK